MSRLLAGSATRDITPGEGVPMAGRGPRERTSTGVNDPLYLRAAAISDGTTAVGIVSADVSRVNGDLSGAIRERAVARSLLEDVVVVATHTHTGPFVPSDLDERLPFYPADLGFTTDNPDVAAVLDTVEDAAVETLLEAADALEPATLRVGRADSTATAENRRAVGGVWGTIDNAGARRDPTAALDPEVTVLAFEGESGAETVLFNHSMHPTCRGGDEFSADWPGVTCDLVAAGRDGATVLFLNGAGGDVRARRSDVVPADDDGTVFTRATGAGVAEAVLEALEDPERVRLEAALGTDSRRLDLPLRSVDRDRVRRHRASLAEEIEARGIEADHPAKHELVAELFVADLHLAIDDLEADTVPTTLQYVAVGDVGLVTAPGEPFVQHGLEFKSHAAADPLLVAGYANEFLVYLPTLEAFHRGGYEDRTARVGPEGIKAWREATFGLIE